MSISPDVWYDDVMLQQLQVTDMYTFFRIKDRDRILDRVDGPHEEMTDQESFALDVENALLLQAPPRPDDRLSTWYLYDVFSHVRLA